MQRLKKGLAFFICLCLMFFNGAGTGSLAAEAEYMHKSAAVQKTESDDAATDGDAYGTATNTDVVDGQAKQTILEYLVIGNKYLDTPASQYVLVGFSGLKEGAVNAALYYTNVKTGEQRTAAVDELDNESAVFWMDFDGAEDTGEYIVDYVEVSYADGLQRINFDNTGIDARFGVNMEIDTDADGVIAADVNEDTSGIVVTDVEGNVISAEELGDILDENGEGVYMSDSHVGRSSEAVVVVLDPGHGGTDSGAVRTWNGVTYYERDINLKIAQYCRQELEKYNNVKVYMTRETNEEDPGLSDGTRVNYAESMGADLLVSIHINSSTSTSPNGAEVYYPNSNYMPEIGEQGEAVAQRILDKLVALGLYNRGIIIKNSQADYPGDTVFYYPDGSLGDYLAIIKQSKLKGIPAVLVEHAFVSNEKDATEFLGSEETIMYLGVADATAIADYFGLSKETEYQDGTASIAAVNDADGKYTLMASGVPGLYGLTFEVKSPKSKKIEYGSFKSADSDCWFSNFNLNSFGKEAGNYTITAYGIRQDGTRYRVGSSTVLIKAPSGGKIVTKNVDISKGVFDIVISDINASRGIAKIEVPVWSADDLNDIYWYEAVKQSDGTYIVHADLSKHNFNYATYAIQAYVTDKNGLRANTVTAFQKMKLPDAVVEAFDADGKTFILTADDVPCVDRIVSVSFSVWSEGVSDKHRYAAEKEPSGRWYALLGADEYEKSGTYSVEVFAKLDNGKEIKIGETDFELTKPQDEPGSGEHPYIKGKCQMPYTGAGGGYLIGLEVYKNDNSDTPVKPAYCEMLILDCTLLAQNKPAWIYTTGKCPLTEENALWTIWQPEYGYFWTLFRVYDKDGNIIDEECYGFQNII